MVCVEKQGQNFNIAIFRKNISPRPGHQHSGSGRLNFWPMVPDTHHNTRIADHTPNQLLSNTDTNTMAACHTHNERATTCMAALSGAMPVSGSTVTGPGSEARVSLDFSIVSCQECHTKWKQYPSNEQHNPHDKLQFNYCLNRDVCSQRQKMISMLLHAKMWKGLPKLPDTVQTTLLDGKPVLVAHGSQKPEFLSPVIPLVTGQALRMNPIIIKGTPSGSSMCAWFRYLIYIASTARNSFTQLFSSQDIHNPLVGINTIEDLQDALVLHLIVKPSPIILCLTKSNIERWYASWHPTMDYPKNCMRLSPPLTGIITLLGSLAAGTYPRCDKWLTSLRQFKASRVLVRQPVVVRRFVTASPMVISSSSCGASPPKHVDKPRKVTTTRRKRLRTCLMAQPRVRKRARKRARKEMSKRVRFAPDTRGGESGCDDAPPPVCKRPRITATSAA